jgi:hypothetical protein
VCDDFDKKMAKKKVVEVWTMGGGRNLVFGFKGGGLNFYEVWICEPDVFYVFSLWTQALLDSHSLPHVSKGRWRRNAQGEIEIGMPVTVWKKHWQILPEFKVFGCALIKRDQSESANDVEGVVSE